MDKNASTFSFNAATKNTGNKQAIINATTNEVQESEDICVSSSEDPNETREGREDESDFASSNDSSEIIEKNSDDFDEVDDDAGEIAAECGEVD